MIKRFDKSKNRLESMKRRRRLKEASEIGYGTYDEFRSDITDELESWGFEYIDDSYWEYYMPYYFTAYYNARNNDAYITMYETDIDGFGGNLNNTRDAEEFGRFVYNSSEYDMYKLVRSFLEQIGAKEIDRLVFSYDYLGDEVIFNLKDDCGTVTYEDGSVDEFDNLYELFDAAGLAP